MHNPDWEKPMDPAAPLPFTLGDWVDLAPYERTLGMTIESFGNGEAVLTMPFTVKLAQGKGILHGGALTSLADTAAAMAIKTLLPEDTHFATVSLDMRFLAPVRKGIVRAHATAGRVEGTQRNYSAQVFIRDEGGKDVAEFSSEFKVAKNQKK
jgi:uncharacterized protein (TIGR00369 family)